MKRSHLLECVRRAQHEIVAIERAEKANTARTRRQGSRGGARSDRAAPPRPPPPRPALRRNHQRGRHRDARRAGEIRDRRVLARAGWPPPTITTSTSLNASQYSCCSFVRARIALMYSTAGTNWPRRKVPPQVL